VDCFYELVPKVRYVELDLWRRDRWCNELIRWGSKVHYLAILDQDRPYSDPNKCLHDKYYDSQSVRHWMVSCLQLQRAFAHSL